MVTVVTGPPPIATPDRPDLHGAFKEHRPARFPLIDFGQATACGACTQNAHATVPSHMVLWPCPVVVEAIADGPAC